MTRDDHGERLLALLRHRWGTEPGWTLRPNKEYGYFLLYRRHMVPLGHVRALIEETFGFASGPTFIIGALPEQTGQAPQRSPS